MIFYSIRQNSDICYLYLNFQPIILIIVTDTRLASAYRSVHRSTQSQNMKHRINATCVRFHSI